MEKNNNSDFEGSSNSSENTNSRLGQSGPAPTNSISRPGPSNSNRPSTSSNHCQEIDRDGDNSLCCYKSHIPCFRLDRDRKPSKKRSRPKNDDRDNEGNSEDDRNEMPNENSTGIPLTILLEMAMSAHRRAAQTMSSQQHVPFPIPQQSQQKIMHQALPYPSYGYIGSENYHMDPSQGAYPLNSFSAMLPINSQSPVSNGMDMVSSENGETTSHVETIVPIFNNLEPITIPHAVLTPPPPNETHSRRTKPKGCRTVYAAGLPEKITEEIIRDAFQICGPISTIRMNPEKICHIRFDFMESVDQAVLLSGFRIRIDESEDPAFNGTMHVDYASAHNDEREYVCLERARLREERYHQQEVLSPPSPPPIPDYSEYEHQSVAKKLRDEETLKDGLQELITWLDRGECNKRNSAHFFSLIQGCHSHVKRLRNEKIRYEQEAQKAKEDSIKKNRAIGCQLSEIEKVFTKVEKQKVWDHFTKTQRKKMEEMKNDTLDLKESNSVDLLDVRKEKEMDLNDTEDSDDNEDMLQEGAADELSILRGKCAEHQDEIVLLRLQLEECKKLVKAGNDSPTSFDNQLSVSDSATQCDPTENDYLLISLIPIFLHVHPFGASIDYICSYLFKIVPSINVWDVDSLLRRFPNLFKEVCTGIGASLERKWTYIGFRY